MTVCACTRTTLEAVSNLEADGARSWREASAACGAGRYCGGCLKNFRAAFEGCRRARLRRQDLRVEAPRAA